MARVRGEKFYGLYEQAMNADRADPKAAEGSGLAGYKKTLRKMLGIVESEWGEPTIDPKQREFDPKDVRFDELWQAFKPRRMSDSELPMAMHREQTLRGLAEAEGHVVLPSHFSNISAFSATVSGLLDALILDAYVQPAFKAEELFDHKESRMSGGKAIGVMNDGEAGDELLPGEAYPTVGLKETSVAIPENQRRGNTIQINELDLIYDRTDKIQDAATNAGVAVRRLKEIACAKVFLGILNNYSRDGNSANTYLKTAGFIPTNYVNSLGSLPLTDYRNIDTAAQTLASNRDPGTGFEIEIPKPIQVAVMPQRYLNLLTITRATEVETRTTDQTVIRRAESPLPGIQPVELPMLYYNLLVASGVSTANAVERWYAGNFKRTFKYRVIIPFESREAPLSSEDVRRDIVLIKIAREIGRAWVWEPRFSFQATNEA